MKDKQFKNLSDYEILGVSYNATFAEIKKAYHKLVMIYHPDKSGNNTKEKMQQINKAYKTLEEQRAKKETERQQKEYKAARKYREAEIEEQEKRRMREALEKQQLENKRKRLQEIIKIKYEKELKYNFKMRKWIEPELQYQILQFSVSLKKWENKIKNLKNEENKIKNYINKMNIKKISPTFNFFVKFITLGFYDLNKMIERKITESNIKITKVQEEIIKSEKESEKVKNNHQKLIDLKNSIFDEVKLISNELEKILPEIKRLKNEINLMDFERKQSYHTKKFFGNVY